MTSQKIEHVVFAFHQGCFLQCDSYMTQESRLLRVQHGQIVNKALEDNLEFCQTYTEQDCILAPLVLWKTESRGERSSDDDGLYYLSDV